MKGIVRDITECKTGGCGNPPEKQETQSLLSNITRHNINNQLLALNGFFYNITKMSP